MAKYDIGILGGGQLGKMLIEEGIRYNISFATLDGEKNSPASYISHHHVQGGLDDKIKVRELVEQAHVSTYEIENINIEILKQLEEEGHQLLPQPAILEMIQNKKLQKEFYVENDIPTAPFLYVEKSTDWVNALQELRCEKFAAKMCVGGYDGKGVALLETKIIQDDITKIPWQAPSILEAFIPCEKEISIMVARDRHGNTKCFPPVEMEFDPIANLVTYLVCPANISASVLDQAETIAKKCVTHSNATGIFAIEMFVTTEGRILVNEMAPRPHNSMHHTIEACYTSQYEQLIRILLDKPLGDCSLIQPAAMINILGVNDFSGPFKLEHEATLLEIPGVYIHLYHKAESKPSRKLGHITVMANTVEELKIKSDKVLKISGVVAK
jgi:5-(carboxyamino)imidazole ribonucleotide synthase